MEEAGNDIYAKHQGKPPLSRDETFFNKMLVDEKTLTMADNPTHTRLRRSMNPAFVPRALAAQEPNLQPNVDSMIKDNSSITTDELELQASILILVGSETMAVALASTTFLLLQNPAALDELSKELHAHFHTESQIDVQSINKLQYLQAVIQEGMHLSPPITNDVPRQTISGGAMVAGHFVPEGVSSVA